MAKLTSYHFHEGEIRLQETVGMRERVERMGEMMLRDHLIDQHREFFSGLQYCFVSVSNKNGQPRAIIITGAQAFLSTPDEKTLRIDLKTSDAGRALKAAAIGDTIGVLGIDLSNRRRNRLHGRIAQMNDEYIDIRVVQSYGNCPKYISIRQLSAPFRVVEVPASQERTMPTQDDLALITSADTFFIASAYHGPDEAVYTGADINHRGGQPGFIHIDDAQRLTVPDYRGNNLFNTLGNLLVNPLTQLLFVNFDNGDLLHLTGTAEIILDAEEISHYPEAIRLLRISINAIKFSPAQIPLRWEHIEGSPYNPNLSITAVS